MTEAADIFDSDVAERLPDTMEYFHYDEELSTIVMRCPVGGLEIFEDVDELDEFVEELGQAVEKAKDEGMDEYESPLPEDPDRTTWD